MPTQIEARYLSGNDLGKKVTLVFTDEDGEETPLTGTLLCVHHQRVFDEDLRLCEQYPKLLLGEQTVTITTYVIDDVITRTYQPHETITLDGNMKPSERS